VSFFNCYGIVDLPHGGTQPGRFCFSEAVYKVYRPFTLGHYWERTGGKLPFCLVFCCMIRTVSPTATATTTTTAAATTTETAQLLL